MAWTACPVTHGCGSASISLPLSPCGMPSRLACDNSSAVRRWNPWCFSTAILWWPWMAPGISPPSPSTVTRACTRNTATARAPILTRGSARRQHHPHPTCIITEDALRANAPHIETLHDDGCHSILGVNAGAHASLFKQVEAAAEAGGVSSYERHERAAGLVHRFRFVNDMPLNGSRKDVRGNFLEYWEVSQDQVQHVSWVTDLRVHRRNVYKLMRGGRARWKIENETCNTLKNQGDHFEHNYGHGEQNLSVVFAMLMMLAFLVDQTQQLCCALFRAVWAKLGSKRMLWERVRDLFYDYAFASMRQLFEALFYGFKKSSPIIAIDSS